MKVQYEGITTLWQIIFQSMKGMTFSLFIRYLIYIIFIVQLKQAHIVIKLYHGSMNQNNFEYFFHAWYHHIN